MKIIAPIAATMLLAVGGPQNCAEQPGDDGAHPGDDQGPDEDAAYRVENLVSDQPGVAPNVDPNLVNPWGLAFGPDTFFWVANEGTSTSTLYDGEGGIQSDLIGGPVNIPRLATADDEEEAGPTGLVFSGGDGFEVAPGAPSRFIFATLEGTLVGWSPDADLRNGIIAVDNSMAGAVYTGLAITDTTSPTGDARTLLYAADFALGTIDVYDEGWNRVDLASELGMEAFVDTALPEGYSPFAVHALDGMIYVAYALVDPATGEEMPGTGNGYVDVFTPQGALRARVASQGPLDAPWGIAVAPENFGRFGGALLVGNFGDGRITAYDMNTYELLGQLEDESGEPIAIDGLWAIAPGNDRMAGDADDIYFTAGPDDETHGLFGEIEAEDDDECDDDDDDDDHDDDGDDDDDDHDDKDDDDKKDDDKKDDDKKDDDKKDDDKKD